MPQAEHHNDVSRRIYETELSRYRLAANILNLALNDSEFVLLTPDYEDEDGIPYNRGIIRLTIGGNILGNGIGPRAFNIMLSGLLAAEKEGYQSAMDDMHRLAQQEGTSPQDHVPTHRLGDDPAPTE